MKHVYLTVISILFSAFSLVAQERDLFHLYGTTLVDENFAFFTAPEPSTTKDDQPLFTFQALVHKRTAGRQVLFTTKKGKPVEGYFFPGTSAKRALVIGGMHGSELSSIEVAKNLLASLSSGDIPFYSVVVIPTLFPDNAQTASEHKDRLVQNAGRYTDEHTADPNRQMPSAGKAFSHVLPVDVYGREMEGEIRMLLQLIQQFRPDRLISLHAIKDRSKAGVFADPRTDCLGNALGFDTDKSLALLMAKHINELGGICPGNALSTEPTAVYYLDPPIAEKGQPQERSFQFAHLTGKSKGVSFGTWSSTAVCDEVAQQSRSAIRTLTMEFPGYLTPSEYKTADEKKRVAELVAIYAASIRTYFLQDFFVEDETAGGFHFASQ